MTNTNIDRLLNQPLFYQIDAFLKKCALIKNPSFITNRMQRYFNVFSRMEKNKQLTASKKLTIEKYKLLLMEAMLHSIQQGKLYISDSKKTPTVPKKLFGYIFSLLGPLFAGIGIFTACKNLFGLMLGIASPVTLGISIVCGVLEGMLFAGVDAGDIRNTLGVSIFKASPIIEVYRKQLTVTKQVHKALLSRHCAAHCSANNYVSYQQAVKLFHDDIREKNTLFSVFPKNTPVSKAIKWIIAGANAISFTISGFILGHGLLGFLSAALLSSPAGWAMGGVVAAFSLASFFYLRRKGIYNLVDTLIGEQRELKIEQDKFIDGESGIKKFTQKMELTIQQKRKNERETKQLKNEIIRLKK